MSWSGLAYLWGELVTIVFTDKSCSSSSLSDSTTAVNWMFCRKDQDYYRRLHGLPPTGVTGKGCAAPVSGWRAGVSSNDIAYFLPSWCWKQLLYKSLRLLTSFYGFRSWHTWWETIQRSKSTQLLHRSPSPLAPHCLIGRYSLSTNRDPIKMDRLRGGKKLVRIGARSHRTSCSHLHSATKELGKGNASETLARHPSEALPNACQYCTSNSNFATE